MFLDVIILPNNYPSVFWSIWYRLLIFIRKYDAAVASYIVLLNYYAR